MTTKTDGGDTQPLRQEHNEQNLPSDDCNDTQSGWGSHRYQPVTEIGVGAYGVVFKAKDLQSDDGFVAMKCLRVENTEQGMPLSMVREIALLRQLETKEHPNVVKLLDICLGRKTSHETQLMLVFEHVDQDLDMYLRNSHSAGLESSAIRNIMQQMLRGIDFLHSMRVIHRDLKPQNILITKTGRIKIADFGLARIFSFEMALTAVVVTLWYRAPEVLLQDSYATPVDLWSVGCIFAELFNRRPLFRGSGDVNQLKKIFEFIGRPSESEWPPDVAIPITSFPSQQKRPPHQFVPRMDAAASDLFMKLLSFDPAQRPTPKKALQHEYFQNMPSFQMDENLLMPSADENLSLHGQGGASNFSRSSFGHHRMPYTKNIGDYRTAKEESSSYVERLPECSYGYNSSHIGHDVPDGSTAASSSQRSSITPSLEQVSTEDCNRGSSSSTVAPRRQRSFGDPLPLNVKDGASGILNTAEPFSSDTYQESAFLTPPSDLASSSETASSSSRCSSVSSNEQSFHADETLSSGLTQEYSTFSTETTLVRPASITPSSGTADIVKKVVKRTRKESEEQSRMSWTYDSYGADKAEAFAVSSDELIDLNPQFNVTKPIFKTPTYQITNAERCVPQIKTVPPNLPPGGHSSQSSYSSSEGDSQSSFPLPEK